MAGIDDELGLSEALITPQTLEQAPKDCVITSDDGDLSIVILDGGNWQVTYCDEEIEDWYLGSEHPNVTIIIPISDCEFIEYPFNMKTRKMGEGQLIERKSFKSKLMEIYGSKRKAIMLAILGTLAAAALGVAQCYTSKADSEGTDRIEDGNYDENIDKEGSKIKSQKELEKDGFC
ncbi:MAG: hypothetical protein Q8P68_03630 [Candidatus Peregrinibacteria bacterium]|nr:hypothetical protein [Candidatus Peregrinibacteria bacterium]MDZ4244751.1 hypothetical protein [Candidatus Gracilibacteria bacterium]